MFGDDLCLVLVTIKTSIDYLTFPFNVFPVICRKFKVVTTLIYLFTYMMSHQVHHLGIVSINR